jgi:hypothetical protein
MAAQVARSTNVQHSSPVRHGLWASAPVAMLVVGEEGSLHPAVAAGGLFFSSLELMKSAPQGQADLTASRRDGRG